MIHSVMPGFVPGIRAFTPVFDGLCPAMTENL
ncbi:MAG: hypothetical protein V7604_638 [Hyphomicrobiales bacterium]|jgi:hypothetical protein